MLIVSVRQPKDVTVNTYQQVGSRTSTPVTQISKPNGLYYKKLKHSRVKLKMTSDPPSGQRSTMEKGRKDVEFYVSDKVQSILG